MSHALHTAQVKGFNEVQKDETPPGCDRIQRGLACLVVDPDPPMGEAASYLKYCP